MDTVAQYFDKRADEWNEHWHNEAPIMDGLIPIVGATRNSRVLDLGSGCGIMAEAYQRAHVKNVTFVDVAPRMIEYAKEHYGHIDTYHFVCEDALAFNDSEKFDCVVIYNAYPHFLDRLALASHVASLLKPHGRFVVAHSMGKDRLNAHHDHVPHNVTFDLLPAIQEADYWKDYFTIDAIVDTPSCFVFAGQVR